MNDKISMNIVSQIFESLTGEKADEQAALLQKSAAETVSCWLRPDVCVTDYQWPICSTIAHLAFYRFCLANSLTSCDKFKAGDVTIEERPQIKTEIAEKLFNTSVGEISHLMKSKRFCFKRV